ncbi:UDP-N-acetylglucosamine 2-epimerase (non-hydrolyzing) [bacterium]|nr:UDP-N-acetylglucosamine 2-epimerase (non-hydrolyzing) [bacterium]
MKILTVVGARPQFVKAAAVSRELRKHKGIKETIVHTGQHFDKSMSDVFFEEMDIPRPDFNLNIHGLSHGAMTGQMMEKLDTILMNVRPDFVLVYGDTNSTLAGALCASKLHFKVAHVEAGLRSFNMLMPEEINRIIVDRISNILFCPTDTAVLNLKEEGFFNFGTKIVKSGDVMYDAAIFYAQKSARKSLIVIDRALRTNDFVLATIHRAENTDDNIRLSSILRALNKIAEKQRVILPLHPRTKKIVQQNGIVLKFDVIDPVGYFDMLELLKNCAVVMTDSGGVQKEAYFFKKPCITLRDETEWTELVEEGFNEVVGSDHDKIIDAYNRTPERKCDYEKKLYGIGNAANLIVEALKAGI